MKDYKKLNVWHKSHDTVLKIYKVSKRFPKEETYGLTSQMRRSAVSIPANIAEGCGKKTDIDMTRFMNISLGSIHETEYYNLLARDLNYINNEEYEEIDSALSEIKAMLIGFIKKVNERNSLN